MAAGKVRFTGRWDRVDFETGGAVIIDFKTTEVKDQKEADRRTRDSLQMDVYALSFLETEGMAPFETRLHFLESDLVGRARKGGKEQERARAEDPRGGGRDQGRGIRAPSGLAQLQLLRIQNDLPVFVRVLKGNPLIRARTRRA